MLRSVKDMQDELAALDHAVQTGVKFKSEFDPEHDGATPKHLRTGVNLAMVQVAAVVSLCVEKGLFTLADYLRSLVAETRKEVERYEDDLSRITGRPVKLI